MSVGVTAPPVIDEVCQILRSCRLRHGTEKELQEGIGLVFAAKGIVFRREEPLTGAGTIDFIILGRVGEELLAAPIGVEVKIKGSVAEIARQVHRYSLAPEIGSVVLASTSMRHVQTIGIDHELNGKPCRVVHLVGSAF